LPRRSIALAVLGAVALAATGCGGSFKDDFKSLNDDILKLSASVGSAIRAAPSQSDDQVKKDFGKLAGRMGDLKGRAEDLDAPDKLKSKKQNLVDAMGETKKALQDIGDAAGSHSRRGAERGLRELVLGGVKLARARRSLARATGAKV
jgi:hypothetical protein